MTTRIGSHLFSAPPSTLRLAAAVALDEAHGDLQIAVRHLERLGDGEALQRARMAEAAAEDALEALAEMTDEEDAA